MLRAIFLNSSTSAKRLFAGLHDVAMACFALVLTLGARYGFDFIGSDPRVLLWLVTFAVICAVVFYLFGLGRGIWRFASLTDLKAICAASAAAIIIFMIVMFFMNRLDGLPRSTPALAWINMVFFLGRPRLLYRGWKDGWMRAINIMSGSRPGVEDILIVGTAADADRVIRTYMLENSPRYRVRGIVELRSGKIGRHVRGMPIIGEIDDFAAIVERLTNNGIAIAAAVMVSPRTDKAALRALALEAARLGIAVRRMPAAGLATTQPQLEAVTLDDLLGRPAVSLDLAGISSLIKNRCICISGAGGSIGAELVRQVAALAPDRIILLDNSEYNLFEVDQEIQRRFPGLDRAAILADIRNGPQMRRIFMAEKPSVVFHAAALKHVPLVEANPCEGVMTNVLGTRHLADAAVDAGTGVFVMISTDKAIRPVSVMGATKRAAEIYCQGLDASGVNTRFITVRFGNVLGSTGSVVPHFKRQIAEGGPVTITHADMRRYFMAINEATELVMQAAVAGLSRPDERGRVFVLDMGEPIRIVDLARTMIALAGLRPDEDIKIEYTGMRPGERLFESIFDDREETVPSGKDGIFIARASISDLTAVRAIMARMEMAARDGNTVATGALLRALVTDFPGDDSEQNESHAGQIVPFLRS